MRVLSYRPARRWYPSLPFLDLPSAGRVRRLLTSPLHATVNERSAAPRDRSLNAIVPAAVPGRCVFDVTSSPNATVYDRGTLPRAMC